MDKTNQKIKLYFDEKIQIFKELEVKFISQLFNKLIDVYLKDGIVFTMGNGGGASAANGFALDLRTHPFTNEDKSITTDIRRIKVVDLCESAGLITGVTNDIGGDFIFTEQLKNWLRDKNENQKHLMIAFSGSGNSKNILNAIEFAKNAGVTTACISGRGGGLASKIVDIPIIVPGHSKFPGQTGKNDNNFHIEEIQISVGHMITGLLKEFIKKG